MTTRLDTRRTFLYKWVYPLFYIAAFIGLTIFSAPLLPILWLESKLKVISLLFPQILIVVLLPLYWRYWKSIIFPLADEVSDDGDHLILRRGKNVEKIHFSSIESAEFIWGNYDPHRICLHLRKDSFLGNKIFFSPKLWMSRSHRELPKSFQNILNKIH